MNSAVITLVFVLIAVVWGLWLIFKRDLMSADLLKVVSYFVGVVVTLMIVLWITTSFLPWWGDRLVMNTRDSENIQNLQVTMIDLWEQATDSEIIISTPVPAATPTAVPDTDPTPTGEPGADSGTPQPTPTPGEIAVTGESLQPGERTYIVSSGNTLYSIAQKYGVTVVAIQQRNGLIGTTIGIGDVLIIPAPTE